VGVYCLLTLGTTTAAEQWQWHENKLQLKIISRARELDGSQTESLQPSSIIRTSEVGYEEEKGKKERAEVEMSISSTRKPWRRSNNTAIKTTTTNN
jgi:hypothetical protein